MLMVVLVELEMVLLHPSDLGIDDLDGGDRGGGVDGMVVNCR